jgi:nitroimidazol reductase NimA-like FMN-containing flavoprotein (pyridoxamine 5'-phosphate oxidase superfamily)
MGGQSRRQLRKGAVLPTRTPLADFDSRYSDPGASATDWEPAREILATTELSWLTTVRPDGRPHTTPLITVWHDGAVHFCTGPEERKHKNLDANPYVVLAAGPNAYADGLDVVLEGEAVPVRDRGKLANLAEAWVAKYGEEWRFDIAADGFRHSSGEGVADVFRIEPRTAFAFGKDPYSQTAFRFG